MQGTTSCFANGSKSGVTSSTACLSFSSGGPVAVALALEAAPDPAAEASSIACSSVAFSCVAAATAAEAAFSASSSTFSASAFSFCHFSNAAYSSGLRIFASSSLRQSMRSTRNFAISAPICSSLGIIYAGASFVVVSFAFRQCKRCNVVPNHPARPHGTPYALSLTSLTSACATSLLRVPAPAPSPRR